MNLRYLDQNIFNLLGLQNLAEEKKQKLLEKINEVVGQRVMLRVMEKLSEQDRQEMDDLLGTTDGEKKIPEFLQGKVDLNAILTEEVLQFKAMMSETVGAAK